MRGAIGAVLIKLIPEPYKTYLNILGYVILGIIILTILYKCTPIVIKKIIVKFKQIKSNKELFKISNIVLMLLCLILIGFGVWQYNENKKIMAEINKINKLQTVSSQQQIHSRNSRNQIQLDEINDKLDENKRMLEDIQFQQEQDELNRSLNSRW